MRPACRKRAFHGATRAVAVLGSRRDVVGISSRAIADDFGDRLGAAAERMFQLFDDEDTGTFTHDEAVAVAVEGAGRTRWRFVEAGRKGPGGGEAAEAHQIDAGFRATANRNVGFAGSNEACGIADRLHARRRKR